MSPAENQSENQSENPAEDPAETHAVSQTEAPADIVIIAAMDEEVAPFLARATPRGESRRVGNSIHHPVVLAARNALVVQGGIGLVNATSAATSALLLACRDAPLVISAGTAGGLGQDVRVGDVVIAANTINADADARAFGYVLGQVPGMPASYPTPESLMQLSAVEPETGGLVKAIHHGLLVSTYKFIGHERSVIIRDQFDGVLATDMESSAIAQNCYSFNVPFLAVRAVSDLCGPASDADFLVHVDDAAERSAEVVMAVIQAWLAAGSPRDVSAPAL